MLKDMLSMDPRINKTLEHHFQTCDVSTCREKPSSHTSVCDEVETSQVSKIS